MVFDGPIISVGSKDYKKHFNGEGLSSEDMNGFTPAWIFIPLEQQETQRAQFYLIKTYYV